MHKLQLSELTMDPRNQRQPLPPPSSANPFTIKQLLELQANTIPWCEGFYGLLFCAGPVYQEMAQQHQHQNRVPRSGPSRNQRSKGFRKAEAQYAYKKTHESSGTIAGDRSTGIHPGHAWIGAASDNTGVGKQMRTKPYNRNRSNRTRKRTDKVDSSAYEIPIVESKRGAMAGNPEIPTPAPSTPASAASMLTAYVKNQKYKSHKQPVKEDDFDTISLGSNTE